MSKRLIREGLIIEPIQWVSRGITIIFRMKYLLSINEGIILNVLLNQIQLKRIVINVVPSGRLLFLRTVLPLVRRSRSAIFGSYSAAHKPHTIDR